MLDRGSHSGPGCRERPPRERGAAGLNEREVDVRRSATWWRRIAVGLAVGCASILGLVGLPSIAVAAPSASPGSVIDCLDWQQRAASGTACADITPTFACVWNNGDGTYTAALGYVNPSSYTLELQPGSYVNSFYGKKGDPNNWGQPALYPPGTSTTYFTITWSQQWQYTLLWQLGTAGHTVTFSSASTPCTSKPVSIIGNVGLVGAALLGALVVFVFLNRRVERRRRETTKASAR